MRTNCESIKSQTRANLLNDSWLTHLFLAAGAFVHARSCRKLCRKFVELVVEACRKLCRKFVGLVIEACRKLCRCVPDSSLDSSPDTHSTVHPTLTRQFTRHFTQQHPTRPNKLSNNIQHCPTNYPTPSNSSTQHLQVYTLSCFKRFRGAFR